MRRGLRRTGATGDASVGRVGWMAQGDAIEQTIIRAYALRTSR